MKKKIHVLKNLNCDHLEYGIFNHKVRLLEKVVQDPNLMLPISSAVLEELGSPEYCSANIYRCSQR